EQGPSQARMAFTAARPLDVGGRVFRALVLRYKPNRRFDPSISYGRSPSGMKVGAGMADRSGSHAKYMTGGDVHVRSLPPEDALGTALWLLDFGLWPVA